MWIVSVVFLWTFPWWAGALQPRLQVPSTYGHVWPHPQFIRQEDFFFLIDPQHFILDAISQDCDILDKAFNRYLHAIYIDTKGNFKEDSSNVTRIIKSSLQADPNFLGFMTHLLVKLNKPCENFPHLEMNETYEIDIGKALLSADSVWGILRGLETFVQMAYKDKNSNLLIIKRSRVIDAPRFKHRGLMLDTSRHYLPKKTILKMTEAMEANKMNVLHWHIVDDQSFPYRSSVYPSLSENGAYHPQHYVYTHQDIEEIIEHARLRGIRVLPEFDTPGHSLSWGKGMANLLTKCYSGEEPSGDFGPIDPSKEENYRFMDNLLGEVTAVFPETHLHIGGDEVDFSCWKSNPDINKFMEEKQIGDYGQLEGYYIKKIIDITEKYQSIPLVWQEVFQHGVNISNQTIVHIWDGNQNTLLKSVTSKGHLAILSTCWYLDHFAMDLYGGGGDWRKFYSCEPLSFNGTREENMLVLGGEACMWGEFVDSTNIIQRVWPRASAAAERLWSPEEINDPDMASRRLEEHVCRMRRRGIKAQPPNGPGACL